VRFIPVLLYTNATFLLASPDPALLAALEPLLLASGARVEIVLTAEAALTSITGHPPALVLLDTNLPGMDPRMTIGQTIGESLDIHRLAPTVALRQARISELLTIVGLDPVHARRYPHEFSGGQRQRVGIARALAVSPKLIVCDEPVSALDASVQAQIINLLQDLQRERAVAYLFVAHDLAVIEHISRRVMVMYLGKVVECGDAKAVVQTPKHPYTTALFSAVPQINPATGARRIILPGEMPSPLDPPKGCPFHPRCSIAEPRCRIEPPALREISPAHFAACHLAR